MRYLPFEYAVRNLGRSRRRLAAAVTGSALVALLVLSAAAFVRGMGRSLSVSGRDDNVILLGAGSEESIERSQVSANAANLISASLPGIRSRLGVPYVSPEIHMGMVVKPTRDSQLERMAILRGVGPAAFLVHPQVRITDGRGPQPASDELMVGALVATRLGVDEASLAIGQAIWFDDRAWKIVGRFEAPGTVMDAEIWVPLTDLQIATKRDNTVSCVILTLGEAEFADVDAFAKQRLDLELVAMRESAYYANLLGFFRPIKAMVWVTAILIALGGLLGGLNTMYAAFASRVRELGALQTIGFSRLALVISMVQESVLTSAVGALIGIVIGLTALDGVAVRFSMGAFGLRVDSVVICTALAAGLALGVIGAIPPAWRCLRLPITDALRTG